LPCKAREKRLRLSAWTTFGGYLFADVAALIFCRVMPFGR
jgi:hypothetical protein